ncbi:MAG: TonB-dependent receptor [Bryobacterales bacterium]|nr:TonB-dependent receptor [Bryobacterales bacterium]
MEDTIIEGSRRTGTHNGDRVAEASVVLESATGRVAERTETDSAGNFRLDAETLQERAQIVVTKPGFATGRLLLGADESGKPLIIRLSLSAVGTEVTVSAEVQGVDSIARVPQQVNVVKSEALRRRGYWNLSAVAAEEPGVAMQQTSPTLGGVFIRGMSGDDVPVFFDGVRVSTSAARGGINTFFNLNEANLLETVELLRGPNTAQYGSDSLGGVVNLITARPSLAAQGTKTHAEWGSAYDSATHGFGSDAKLSHAGERFGILAAFSGKRVNTLRPGGTLDSRSALTRFLGLPSTTLYDRIPDTAFTQYGGSLHGDWAASDTSQLVGHYQRSQQDGGRRPDQLLSGDGNLVADLRNLMADLAYLRYNAFPDRWIDRITATGSFLAQREERRNQGGQGDARAAIRSEFERTTVWGSSVVLGRNRGRNYQLAFGGDAYKEDLQAHGSSVNPSTGAEGRFRARIPDKAGYLQSGAFFQSAWSPLASRLRVSGALRWHRASYRVREEDAPLVNGAPLFAADSLVARNLSGRVGAVLGLVGGLRLRGYYARGFRAPTVTNLGTLGLTGNGYEVGSAELGGLGAVVGSSAGEDAASTGSRVEQLRPEISDNLDAGISWEGTRLRFDFTGFWIERRDVLAKRALILPQGAEGLMLGDQPVSRQDASGIVFVPLVPNPVLVRTNAGAARFRGLEQSLRLQIGRRWILSNSASYVHAADRESGLAPDIGAGVPAPNLVTALRYLAPGGRFWLEAAADGNLRQGRISSVGLADRRVGAVRSRSSIARYFANGAVAQGLVSTGADGRLGTVDDMLLPSGETLSQVQMRVLGSTESAPLYPAIPGFLLLHLRTGWRVGEASTLLAGIENLADRNYRGMAWGIDGRGRSAVVQWQTRF